jgi:hypothetical protein
MTKLRAPFSDRFSRRGIEELIGDRLPGSPCSVAALQPSTEDLHVRLSSITFYRFYGQTFR